MAIPQQSNIKLDGLIITVEVFLKNKIETKQESHQPTQYEIMSGRGFE